VGIAEIAAMRVGVSIVVRLRGSSDVMMVVLIHPGALP